VNLLDSALPYGSVRICAMLGIDVAGFSADTRTEDGREQLRAGMYKALIDALEDSGIRWADCSHKDEGDGAIVTLVPGFPADALIAGFPERLRDRIGQHNRMSAETNRMQLRMAVHVGRVCWDAHGVVSDDLTRLCRLLDADPVRAALAESGTELAMVVSDYVYETHVLRRPSLADPADFKPLRCMVKHTPVSGWLYLPGGWPR
jgi:hypothetical protein